MSVTKKLQKNVEKRAQETVMKLMADERTRPIVAKAMQTYMESRQRVDEVRDQTAQNLGLVTQQEFKQAKSRLRRMEKDIDKLSRKFTSLEEKLAG